MCLNLKTSFQIKTELKICFILKLKHWLQNMAIGFYEDPLKILKQGPQTSLSRSVIDCTDGAILPQINVAHLLEHFSINPRSACR